MNPFNYISDDGTELKFKKLTDNATTPVRGSRHAAGFDLFSAETKEVLPQCQEIVKTDIGVILPRGTYGRVAPRSGLAVKHFIDVGAGVVDFDYRGNVGVVLFNHNANSFQVKKGDKIAQFIVEKICVPRLVEVSELGETERGTKGYGSTGK
jgi:dUTP pyrophosphatase